MCFSYGQSYLHKAFSKAIQLSRQLKNSSQGLRPIKQKYQLFEVCKNHQPINNRYNKQQLSTPQRGFPRTHRLPFSTPSHVVGSAQRGIFQAVIGIHWPLGQIRVTSADEPPEKMVCLVRESPPPPPKKEKQCP